MISVHWVGERFADFIDITRTRYTAHDSFTNVKVIHIRVWQKLRRKGATPEYEALLPQHDCNARASAIAIM